MIQEFVDKFMEAKPRLLEQFKRERPEDYDGLVTELVKVLADEDEHRYECPDPERITVIDHGHYQGTRLFIIGARDYQPSTYWAIRINYGSCSVCDTFEANRGWDDAISDKEAEGNVTMMLHMVQEMREIARME